MGLVLLLAGVLWGVGHVTGAPRRLRWRMIGVLYLGVLLLHATLPDGNPVREATGGSAVPWLVLGAGAALALGYRAVLRRLRARARQNDRGPEPGGGPEAPFSAAERERYARHIVLREIGGPGQRKLKSARVLVIGAGGLGAPALLYLGGAGVGTLGVIDDDTVEPANLQRQIIHAEDRAGMPKVFSAEAAVRALNPHVEMRPYHRRLTDSIAGALFEDYDLVLDGSDNFETRYLVNRAAVATGTPLIAAAITQWEGQIGLYEPARGTPCYQCLFPEAPAEGLAPACAEAGVAGPLPGVLGAMMALEAVKEITGAGSGLAGRLTLYDGLHGETRSIAVAKRADCPVCGAAVSGSATPWKTAPE